MKPIMYLVVTLISTMGYAYDDIIVLPPFEDDELTPYIDCTDEARQKAGRMTAKGLDQRLKNRNQPLKRLSKFGAVKIDFGKCRTQWINIALGFKPDPDEVIPLGVSPRVAKQEFMDAVRIHFKKKKHLVRFAKYRSFFSDGILTQFGDNRKMNLCGFPVVDKKLVEAVKTFMNKEHKIPIDAANRVRAAIGQNELGVCGVLVEDEDNSDK